MDRHRSARGPDLWLRIGQAPAGSPAAAGTPTPEPLVPAQSNEDVEEEYHQPPKPASADLGETITLTGNNIGVRLRVTPTALLDPRARAAATSPSSCA